jgi:putative membrane protein
MFGLSNYAAKKRRGFFRWIFAGVFALLLLGLVFGLLAFGGIFGHFAPGPYYRGPFFFFPFGFLLFAFVLFAIFRFAFWGWGWHRGYYGGSWRANGGSSALEILDQRYARGDITKEQYDQMKNDILRKA